MDAPAAIFPRMRTRLGRGSLLLLLAGSLACSTARDVTSVGAPRLPVTLRADSTRIQFTLPRRPGQLTAAQVREVAPRAASLRSEPSELFIRLGDSVLVQSLVRIIAVDSAGVDLGELHGYDFTPRGRSLWLVRDGRLWARDMGTTEFVVSFPRTAWPGDRATAPRTTILIHASPTARTSPPIAPAGTP